MQRPPFHFSKTPSDLESWDQTLIFQKDLAALLFNQTLKFDDAGRYERTELLVKLFWSRTKIHRFVVALRQDFDSPGEIFCQEAQF